MNGKKVEMSLNTPILLRSGDVESADRLREEAVFRIVGKVETFSETGVLIEIIEMTGNKQSKVTSGHATVFIPMHKIDHIFVLA